jgi:hypothetical protein
MIDDKALFVHVFVISVFVKYSCSQALQYNK